MTYMSYCDFINFYLLVSKIFYYKDLQSFRSDINSALKKFFSLTNSHFHKFI